MVVLYERVVCADNNERNILIRTQVAVRKRGRPKKLIKDIIVPLSIKEKIDEAVSKNEGQPAIYASTTKGTVKLLYDGHHFRYSFRKGKYSIFQCCYKENREECKVRVVTDHKLVYPLDGEHVHFMHATDKSVTSVKFTPGAETNENVEKANKEIRNNENDEEHQKELQIVSLDEHFPEFAEVIEEKSITDDEIKQKDETKLTIDSKSGDQSTTPITVESVVRRETEEQIEDPNDFREKIKKRLQKALLGKKKQ